MSTPASAASSAATAQIPNRIRYAVSDGSSIPPAVSVTAASRLPPTALASVLPSERASEWMLLAAARSSFGVWVLISVGSEA